MEKKRKGKKISEGSQSMLAEKTAANIDLLLFFPKLKLKCLLFF